jgi:hypothetical protein
LRQWKQSKLNSAKRKRQRHDLDSRRLASDFPLHIHHGFYRNCTVGDAMPDKLTDLERELLEALKEVRRCLELVDTRDGLLPDEYEGLAIAAAAIGKAEARNG